MERIPVNIDFPKIIISLFDYSGEWSKWYRINGFRVIQIDIKLGLSIYDFDYKSIARDLVKGIIAAPPCTDFSVSGAQYWQQKDADGRTAKSVALVKKTLEIIDFFNPEFWALENPVGRLPKLVPELQDYGPFYFNPCDYGDPWTKKTGLWGSFKPLLRNPVNPIKYSSQGSWTQLLGGKGEKVKELRSVTPPIFRKRFMKQIIKSWHLNYLY